MTQNDLVKAAKNAYASAKQPLSRSDFERITGISQHYIYHLFPEGGWSELQRLAKIPIHPQNNQRLSDDRLLKEFHSVATVLDDVPTWPRFNQRANVSADVVRRRFGGRQGTLDRYRTWLEENHPDAPLLTKLRDQARHEVPSLPHETDMDGLGRLEPVGSWTPADGSTSDVSGEQYGPPIEFRGLRHAPINEQGVVFLFGMVSREIGFLV